MILDFLKSENKVTVNMTVVFFTAVMFVLLFSCSRERKEMSDAITERDSLPSMKTYGVETLISDSGIIRYKIQADEWLVYDRKQRPYWAFEKGIYLEKFDSLHRIDASIVADTAYYFVNDKIWTLIGGVDIKNMKGERFQTELLNWNQALSKIYSDKFITIEQEDKTITGYGFESNQQMTKYTINNITGIFYISDTEKDTISGKDSLSVSK